MRYVPRNEYMDAYTKAVVNGEREAFQALDTEVVEQAVYDFFRTGVPIRDVAAYVDETNRYWVVGQFYDGHKLLARIASDHVVVIKPRMSEGLRAAISQWCDTTRRTYKEWRQITTNRPSNMVLYAKGLGVQQLPLPEPFDVSVRYEPREGTPDPREALYVNIPDVSGYTMGTHVIWRQ